MASFDQRQQLVNLVETLGFDEVIRLLAQAAQERADEYLEYGNVVYINSWAQGYQIAAKVLLNLPNLMWSLPEKQKN